MMSDETQKLRELVKNSVPGELGEFRPAAFFDDRLDCIRVLARDCSVFEERINDRLTVIQDNYPGPGRSRYVGFTVKGARHFCKEFGWDLATPIKMTSLLDAVVSASPEMVVDLFINLVARPLVRDGKIEEVQVGQVHEPALEPAWDRSALS